MCTEELALLSANSDSDSLLLLLSDSDCEEDRHGRGPVDDRSSTRIAIGAGNGKLRWGGIVGDGNEDEARGVRRGEKRGDGG